MLSGDCGYRAGGKRKLNGTDNLNANALSVNRTTGNGDNK